MPQETAIRPETAADAEAVHAVATAAFGREDEALLVEALRGADGFDARLSLVAEWQGRVVGHVLLSPIVIRGAEGETPALALAPVSVSPEHQRQGIGEALTRAVLERAAELGHRVVIVLGHPEYYPRFGFRPAAEFRIHAPFEVPDEAFMALALSPGALDGCVGTVVYPPAFGV